MGFDSESGVDFQDEAEIDSEDEDLDIDPHDEVEKAILRQVPAGREPREYTRRMLFINRFLKKHRIPLPPNFGQILVNNAAGYERGIISGVSVHGREFTLSAGLSFSSIPFPPSCWFRLSVPYHHWISFPHWLRTHDSVYCGLRDAITSAYVLFGMPVAIPKRANRFYLFVIQLPLAPARPSACPRRCQPATVRSRISSRSN